MATTAVDIVVKANTSALTKLDRALKGSEQKIEKLSASLQGKVQAGLKAAGNAGVRAGEKIKRGFATAGNAAAKFGKSVSGLRGQLAGLGVGAGLTKSFFAASELETAQTRVKVLGQTYQQLAGIQDTALQSAEKFRLSNVEAINAYIDLGNRLGEQGASVEDLQNVFEGLNTVFAINKTSAQEAASAQLQLNQALGSGRLAGEEFNAINEAAPQVISEVARVLGVARGQVKKLASEGQVSSQVLIQALTNIRKDGASQLEGAFDGSFGAVKEFNVALQEFSQVVGKELLPAITPLIKGATELLKGFGKLPAPVKTASVAIAAVGAAAVVAGPAIVGISKAVLGLISGLGALKLGAAAAGMTKFALAAAGLKVALLALPWVAVAAGVTALGVAIYNTKKSQKEFNDLVFEGKGTVSELLAVKQKYTARLQEVNNKLKGVNGETKATGREFRNLQREAKDLTKVLEQIPRTIDIKVRLQTEGFTFDDKGNATGYSVLGTKFDLNTGLPINPPPTVSEIRETNKPFQPALGTPIGSMVGGDAATQVKEAVTPLRELAGDINQQQLQNTIDSRLLENQKQINAAKATGNDELIRELENKRELISVNENLAALEGLLDRMQSKKGVFKGTAKEFEQEITQVRQIYDGFLTEFYSITNNQEARAAELVRAQAKAREDALRPLNEQRELLEAKLNGNETEARLLQEARNIARDLPNLTEAEALALLQKNDQLQKSVDLMEAQKEAQKQLASDIAGELTGALGDVIKQTKTVEEAFSTMLKNIGDMFIDMAMKVLQDAIFQQLIKLIPALFGGGPAVPAIPLNGFAQGGQILPNSLAIVGEQGPEIITTNNQPAFVETAGSTRELMRQYSPANAPAKDNGGGNGSSQEGLDSFSAAMTPTTFKLETRVINGIEYATVDQLREVGAAATQEGAKQGEIRALQRLRMNPATRRKVGI